MYVYPMNTFAYRYRGIYTVLVCCTNLKFKL